VLQITYIPFIGTETSISSVATLVLQTRESTGINRQRVFYASGAGIFGGPWSEITDADFVALFPYGKMEHVDGYAFILDSNNRIYNSDLNSLANWTATSFLAKQIQQDYPVGLARIGNQLLAFGERTCERFYNAGNTTGSPLGRIPHTFERTGMQGTTFTTAGGSYLNGATEYYATIKDRIYFVGNSSSGLNSVGAFSASISGIERISTPYIDKILSEKSSSIYSVTKVSFGGQDAAAFCWTAPGAVTQQWLMFFPQWKEWFEWTSTVFSPVNNGTFFLGTSSRDRVYTFGPTDNWQDNGTSYPWLTQFRLPTKGSNRVFMPMYGVDADTDTSANSQTVEISTDDCATFSTLGTLDFTQDRKVLFRGGSFRKAHIRIGATNARPARLHNFLARLE
jgi:hypothetical protein